MTAVGFPPQDRREEPDHVGPGDRITFMIPASVARNPHRTVARTLGVPAFNRRQFLVGSHLRNLTEREARQVLGQFGHRHGPILMRQCVPLQRLDRE